MAGIKFTGNMLWPLAKGLGILLIVLAFMLGWTVILNFGTLLKIGAFVLGLLVAKKFIFGG